VGINDPAVPSHHCVDTWKRHHLVTATATATVAAAATFATATSESANSDLTAFGAAPLQCMVEAPSGGTPNFS